MNHTFRDRKGVHSVSGKGHINNVPNAADGRTELGYGTLRTKFHGPRSYLQYNLTDREEDVEAAESIDDETYEAVLSRLSSYQPGDPLAKNKVDPFTFAGAATKISEAGTAKGMVPYPKMYRNRDKAVGGTSPRYPEGPADGFNSRIRPTGTKMGYSKPPYPRIEDGEDDAPLSLQDIITKDPDQEHLEHIYRKLRKVQSQNR